MNMFTSKENKILNKNDVFQKFQNTFASIKSDY